MNRKITFRGKSKSNKWIFGDLIRNEEGSFAIVPPFKLNSRNECSDYEVSEETIGQYIGRNDVKDSPIYEGDIVRANEYMWMDSEVLVVKWFPMLSCFALFEKHEDEFPFEMDWTKIDIYIEVIGNVFDNKNLLDN